MAFVVWVLIWRTKLGYEIRTIGFSPKAARYAGISETRIIIVTMLISGALAGMMALNPIMGDQHHVSLDFVAGAGFVGIAVALMGRSHPVGIVLAAILFGMLYQGGAELAFEMPNISRDMIVIIQGLVILFAGALEHMFRPPVQAVFASFSPRSVGVAAAERGGRLRWNSSTLSSTSSTRPSASRCRCCSPASPASIPSASGVFDIGLEGKMLAGAFAAGAAAAVYRLGLGRPHRWPSLVSVVLALVHGFASITHRGNQIVSGVAINFIAAGSTIILGQAWFGQGGRTPSLAGRRPLRRDHAARRRRAARRADPRPHLFRADLRPHAARLPRLPGGAVHLVGALPHPLRPAAARRRREPGRRRHGRHLGRLAALPRRHLHRRL